MIPLEATLPIGFIIEQRYEIEGFLGAGAHGVVYQVLDHHLESQGALKILSMSGSTRKVWKEAILLRRLQGKYVLPVLDANLTAGAPFIVTEIARHGTIGTEILPGIGIPVPEAVRWARHACRGLGRVHDLGLLHNDVKPENLFLDSNRDVLVGDLSLAQKMKSSGRAPVTGCSPETAAPEVAAFALDQASTDLPGSIQSDIYALGATLYWMLAGEPPHLGSTPESTLMLARDAAPRRLQDVAPHVPLTLCRVVETAMARDPSARYKRTGDLDQALGLGASKTRVWNRTAAHPRHEECFVGVAGKSVLLVCVEPGQHPLGREIHVSYATSGRRKSEPTICRSTDVRRRLRAIFRAHK